MHRPPKPLPAPRRRPETCVLKQSEPLPHPRKPRPLVYLFWTVHGPFVSGLRAAASRRLASGTRLRAQSLFIRGIKTGAPAKSKILWGEEEGTEQSGVLAVRRGRSGRSFFRRHGGCNEPAVIMAVILPARQGEHQPRPPQGDRQGSSRQSGILMQRGPPRPLESSALGMVWTLIPASSRERFVT